MPMDPSRRGFLAEINVTPFVDVMLVLLIIFMVTAPLLTQGVEVDLPKTRAVKTLPKDSENLVLSVKKDG
ncbi:MAG: biopolymer transporter ExbD, partial [Desulfovibrionaceae bacterium]|nr:biopolymer transporter ExbD [Desulfovibrionaceae bacterium]